MNNTPGQAALRGRFLLVMAGDHVCALPLERVRRIVPALKVHPLPATDPRLLGLAEYDGEPLPVFDLGALVQAPVSGTAEYPITVVAWAGPSDELEAVGLTADRALGLAEHSGDEIVGRDAGFVRGEVGMSGRLVQLLDLSALGAAR